MSGEGGCDSFETETTDCKVSENTSPKQLSSSPQMGSMRLVKAGSCMLIFIFEGPPFVECIIMDSSPANSIFKKPLAELSTIILRMCMELLDFRLKIVYIPGKRQSIVDALSRHPTDCNIWPLKDPSTEWYSPHYKVGCNFAICYNTIDTNDPLLSKFYEAAAIDEDYMKIVKVVACGSKRGEMRRKVDKLHPAFPLSYMWVASL